MLLQAKVVASLLDGTSQEAEGPIFGLADRVAFERLFRVPAAKLGEQLELLFDDRGKVKEGADLSGFREEWLAFFIHRVLLRAKATIDEYEMWLTKVEDVDLGIIGPKAPGDEVPNPTDQAPPPGASQS